MKAGSGVVQARRYKPELKVETGVVRELFGDGQT